MRRAASGEIVQYKAKSETWNSCAWSPDISWNWVLWDYRILDFPEPPKGQEWHNPNNHTATKVGVHEGWRLLTEEEYIKGNKNHRGDVEYWWHSRGRFAPLGGSCELVKETIRTKEPYKPGPTPEELEEDAMEKASTQSAAASWAPETMGHQFRNGWKAHAAYLKGLK